MHGLITFLLLAAFVLPALSSVYLTKEIHLSREAIAVKNILAQSAAVKWEKDAQVVTIIKATDNTWQACTELPVLGNSCVEIYAITSNLTIGIRLIIQNVTIFEQAISGNKVCLNEKTLLQLISFIPPLLPFKPLIDYLIAALGFIPATVFSVCLELQNLNITRTEASGCVDLKAVLMCWENSCLANYTHDFGCFKIRF